MQATAPAPQIIDLPTPNTRLLKWAGSKVRSAAGVEPFLIKDRLYIEPFCGSAAFYFSGGARKAHLNDTNKNLISFYEEVKNNADKVWKIYNSIEISSDTYYAIRDKYNSMRICTRKAAYFMYLNHFGFNGIYRTNRDGKLNTPFGSAKKIKKKITIQDIAFYSQYLSSCSLTSLDFETFLRKLSPENACIYMDPPYFTADSRVFGEYGKKIFSERDLDRLFRISEFCMEQGNRVVVSYKNCTEFSDIFGKYIVSSVVVQRNVGGFSGRRKHDTELIAVLG